MTDQPDTAARILAAVENALGDQLTPTAHAEALDSIRRILADQPAPAPLTLPRDQVAAVRDICNRLLGTAPAAVAPSPKAPQSQDAELTRLRAELATLRAVARGYCPHCGRGDCAPTAADWERERARAERAEAERDELRDEIAATVARLADMAKSRAEQDGVELVRLRARVVELEARDTPSWRQRAEQAQAERDRLRARVQAAADEARGSVRDWLLDALADAADPREPSTAQTMRERAEAASELASLAVNAARALRDEKRHYQIACEENARLRAAIERVRKAVAERCTEVAEYEAENPPSAWSDAVTVTCDRIDDALRHRPEPQIVLADPDQPKETQP